METGDSGDKSESSPAALTSLSRTNSYLHLPVYCPPQGKFSNDNPGSYRWKFLATSYLLICILISAIYVAIYAENTFYYPEDYLAYLRYKQNVSLTFIFM